MVCLSSLSAFIEAVRKIGVGHAERNFAFWRGVESLSALPNGRQNARAMPGPEQAQGAGNVIRVFVDQDVEFVGDNPATLGDFLRVQVKGTRKRAEQKNLDELVA